MLKAVALGIVGLALSVVLRLSGLLAVAFLWLLVTLGVTIGGMTGGTVGGVIGFLLAGAWLVLYFTVISDVIVAWFPSYRTTAREQEDAIRRLRGYRRSIRRLLGG